jgi:hypothetical protein
LDKEAETIAANEGKKQDNEENSTRVTLPGR